MVSIQKDRNKATYFKTADRAFTVTDLPGHPKYFHNFVTGLTRGDAAIFVIPIRDFKSDTEIANSNCKQFTAAFTFGIRHIIVAANKIDENFAYKKEKFEEVASKITT